MRTSTMITRLSSAVLLSLLLAPLSAQGPPGPGADRGMDPARRQPREGKPDVLVFVIDDVGWSDLASVPTPAIDELAATGVSYERFYSMPSCSPTRYEILFGRFGRRDGIGRIVTSYLPPAPDNPTPHHELLSLPKVAKSLGYGTAMIGKWHLGRDFLGTEQYISPHLHGFDAFRAGAQANLGGGGGSGYYDWLRIDDGFADYTTEYATAAQRDAAIQWWVEAEGPRLMVMSFSAPHGPYEAPPPEMLPPDWPVPTNARERFEAMLIAADQAVGSILAGVNRAETLVFFISDNGTPRGVAPAGGGGDGIADPLGRYKNTTYEGGIRVPMIVSGPGVARGERCKALVCATDVLRTVADVLGFEGFEAGAEDSISFARTLRAPTSAGKRPWVFAEQYDDENDDRAVVMERYKLRVFNNRRAIYDLLLDPGEENGVPPSDPRYPELLAELQDVLLNQVPPRL